MGGLLIGLGGLKRSGKDTVADRLVGEHGFAKNWMSEPLNEALSIVNPYVGVLGDGTLVRYAYLVEEVGYEQAKEFPEVRRLLQRFGTEFGRKMVGETIWTELVFRAVDEQLAAGKDVAITGIRYFNELEEVRRRGGILLHVQRPQLEDRAPAELSTHDSEVSLVSTDFDETISNEGTLHDLHQWVDLSISRWRSMAYVEEPQPSTGPIVLPTHEFMPAYLVN